MPVTAFDPEQPPHMNVWAVDHHLRFARSLLMNFPHERVAGMEWLEFLKQTADGGGVDATGAFSNLKWLLEAAYVHVKPSLPFSPVQYAYTGVFSKYVRDMMFSYAGVIAKNDMLPASFRSLGDKAIRVVQDVAGDFLNVWFFPGREPMETHGNITRDLKWLSITEWALAVPAYTLLAHRSMFKEKPPVKLRYDDWDNPYYYDRRYAVRPRRRW